MIHKFPEEIIHDILFRLPAKSLIKCTSVCKLWRSMIKNPTFIGAHRSRTINFNNQFGTHLLLLHCVPRAILDSDIYDIGIDEPVEEHYYLRYDNHAFDEYCKIEFPIVPKEEVYNKFLRVVGSCNGLVFIADDVLRLGYTFIIFNPTIRKSVTLPKPHLTFETCGPYSACVGFGFDAMTNDYKVVRILTDQCENPTSYEVYSLARGSWSSPSPVVPHCEILDMTSHVFVEGTLHWDAWYRTGDRKPFILAFDVGSELFREIMMPKTIIRGGWRLSVTGDRKSIALFTSSYSMEHSLDIWVMKEYCMEESWTKLITLIPQGPERSEVYKVLCFRKSGEVVLVWTDDYYCDKRELVSLDLVSKQFKNLGIHEYKYYYAYSYEESLILLDKTDAVSY